MTNASENKERRKFRRYPAAVVKAKVREKKGLFSEDWVERDVVDYSTQGVALVLATEPEIDQMVTTRLILEMDMGDIKVDKLEAKVRNKVKTESGWRTGLEFSSASVKENGEKLERITRLLEKSASVNERLQKQVTKNKISH